MSEPRIPPIKVALFSIAVLFALLLAFLSGYFFHTYFSKHDSNFPILVQAYQIFQNHAFFKTPESNQLEYGMIRGMLQASGDPYAVFLEPVQQELSTNSLEGSFGGIGVEIDRSQEGFFVLIPFPNGPAEMSGVLAGDRLLKVDDLVVDQETSLETVQAALRGPEGEYVQVVIGRAPTYTPLLFRIRRDAIQLPSTIQYLAPNHPQIGVLQVNLIANSTPDEILEAVSELKSRGVSRFILDLRDNGGGLLEAGIDTARLFLDSGIVMQQQHRGQALQSYPVEEPGPLADLPLVVLINQNTASAAEIVAGAIKAQKRAELIGTPTFGKDTIQLVFDLSDRSSIRVTAAQWWVPGLDPPIGNNGIQPDTLINPDASEGDPALQAAIESHLRK
jgi:carboxyl-terminal processing protease